MSAALISIASSHVLGCRAPPKTTSSLLFRFDIHSFVAGQKQRTHITTYLYIYIHIYVHAYIHIDTYTYVSSVAYVWFFGIGGFVRVSVVTRGIG